MGRLTGRRGERRLVDMSVPEEPPTPYYPPPVEDCDETPEFPIVISVTERIHGRGLIYRGKMVDFSITIQVRDQPGSEWVDVARIDCAHSTVHIHQFYSSRSHDDRTVICRIPADGADEDSWQVVDTQYDAAIFTLTERFDEFVRRWRTG